MNESRRNSRFLAIGLAALASFSAAVWFTLDESQDVAGSAGHSEAENALEGGTASMSGNAPSPIRIGKSGRLVLDTDSLPTEGPLILALDLPDEARGNGERPIRIASVDGRKIETTTNPVAGAGTGVRLEIDSAFLSRGLYMIEIETVDNHPLRIRRYVLELN